jgi:dGTPase
LEPHFRPTCEHTTDGAGRLRVVVDQVASLTDISVVTVHMHHSR